jgi:hypothetical protein
MTIEQDNKVGHFADLMKQFAPQYNAIVVDIRALDTVTNGVNSWACNAYDLHPCNYQPIANALLPVLLSM